MKKIISIMLALVLVLSMGTVALAADDATGDATTPTTWEDMETVTLTKEYKATNRNTTSPAEDFSFSTLTCTSVTDAADGVNAGNAPVPTIGKAAYTAGEAGSATAKKDITITLPEYNSVGIYTYTFTETVGSTAGVTYRTTPITLKVTVIEQEGKVRVAAIHTESAGAKSGSFDNTYSAGSLAVTKDVTGNMGDKNKEFKVTVKFTAPTGKTVRENITYVEDGTTKTITPAAWVNNEASVVINLKDAETITFTNIPYEVTYTVVEDNYTGEGYEAASYDDKQNGTISSASVQTVITNEKNSEVDMGVALDSMPYVLMLVVVAAGLFVLISKKRAAREN